MGLGTGMLKWLTSKGGGLDMPLMRIAAVATAAFACTSVVITGTMTCFYICDHGFHKNMRFVAFMYIEAFKKTIVVPSLSFSFKLIFETPNAFSGRLAHLRPFLLRPILSHPWP